MMNNGSAGPACFHSSFLLHHFRHHFRHHFFSTVTVTGGAL